MLKKFFFAVILGALPVCLPLWIESRDTKVLLNNRRPPIPSHGRVLTIQHSDEVMRKVATRAGGAKANPADFSATVDMYYEAHLDDCNLGNNGGKNFVMFVPTNGATWQFTEVISLFRAQGYCTLIMDPRAHGRTEAPPGELSAELMGEDAAHLIKQVFQGHPAHILGWSLGGAVAYYVTLEHPELVATTTVSGMTSCFGKVLPGGCDQSFDFPKWFFSTPLITRLVGTDNQFTAAKLIGLCHDSVGLRSFFQAMVPIHAAYVPAVWGKWDKNYYHNRLQDIKSPVLILAGQHDAEVGFDEPSLKADSQRISGPSEVFIFHGMSHAFWFEHTEGGASGSSLGVQKMIEFHQKHPEVVVRNSA